MRALARDGASRERRRREYPEIVAAWKGLTPEDRRALMRMIKSGKRSGVERAWRACRVGLRGYGSSSRKLGSRRGRDHLRGTSRSGGVVSLAMDDRARGCRHWGRRAFRAVDTAPEAPGEEERRSDPRQARLERLETHPTARLRELLLCQGGARFESLEDDADEESFEAGIASRRLLPSACLRSR